MNIVFTPSPRPRRDRRYLTYRQYPMFPTEPEPRTRFFPLLTYVPGPK